MVDYVCKPALWLVYLSCFMLSFPLFADTHDQQASHSSPTKPLGLETLFLERANRAMSQGLYFPDQSSVNAFDSFRSVLQLNPDNKAAKAGLDNLVLNASEAIRQYLRKGQVDRAQKALQRYVAYLGENPVFRDLEHQIRVTNEKKQISVSKNSETVLLLPPSPLSQRADAIQTLLSTVAVRIKKTGESIIIFARTDAEGRWIYKQIKIASGILVRGDIKLSQQPRIEFLPPI